MNEPPFSRRAGLGEIFRRWIYISKTIALLDYDGEPRLRNNKSWAEAERLITRVEKYFSSKPGRLKTLKFAMICGQLADTAKINKSPASNQMRMRSIKDKLRRRIAADET